MQCLNESMRSEEHTSELQSHSDLVCRLLLENRTREGTFSICTFWLVECLTRAGRTEEARLIMEKMFTYANHLGLYAEESGASGEALGHFPQAFTHLALISAAVNLDRALGGRAVG